MKLLHALPLLALLPSVVMADDPGKLPPISADRPDFTNGAYITPRGKIVLETGFRYTSFVSGQVIIRSYGDSPLFRIGMTSNFEVRLGPGSYDSLTAPGFHTTGFEDGTVGFKYRFHEGKEKSGFSDPSLALGFSTTVPTGGRDFRERALQPTLTGIIDFAINEKDDLGVNANYSLPRDNGHQFGQWALSGSLSHQFSDRVSGFAEMYGLFPEFRGGTSVTFGDFGVTYLVNNDLQLDAFFGGRMKRGQQETFFGVGLSVRF